MSQFSSPWVDNPSKVNFICEGLHLSSSFQTPQRSKVLSVSWLTKKTLWTKNKITLFFRSRSCASKTVYFPRGKRKPDCTWEKVVFVNEKSQTQTGDPLSRGVLCFCTQRNLEKSKAVLQKAFFHFLVRCFTPKRFRHKKKKNFLQASRQSSETCLLSL